MMKFLNTTSLLTSRISTAIATDISAIVMSSILSIVLIVVTIVNAQRSNKIQMNMSQFNRQASLFPFKSEIINSLLKFDKNFYTVITQVIEFNGVSQADIDYKIVEFNNMITELDEDIVKMGIVFNGKSSTLVEPFKHILDKAENLLITMRSCNNRKLLYPDMQLGYNNRTQKLLGCTKLVRDILSNTTNFSIFTDGMNAQTKVFLGQYVEVFNLLNNMEEYCNNIMQA